MDRVVHSHQRYTVALGANAEFELPFYGNHVRILSATGAFAMALNDGPFSGFEAGLSFNTAPGILFEKVRLRDASGALNTIDLVIALGDTTDSRLSVSSALNIARPSAIQAAADVAVAAASTAQIVAANSARHSVVIKNLSANASAFRIGDSDAGAARGHELLPGETIVLETTAAIYGYNADAGAQSVSVIEQES